MSDGYEYFQFNGAGLHSQGDEVYEPVGNPCGWRSMGDLEPFSKGRIYRRKVNPNVRLESKEELATQQHAQNWLKIQPFLRDLLDNSSVQWQPTNAISAAYDDGYTHRGSWRVLLRSLFANTTIAQPAPVEAWKAAVMAVWISRTASKTKNVAIVDLDALAALRELVDKP